MTPNLKSVKILYGVLGGDQAREAAAKALEKARGFVRSSLYETLTIKRVPDIHFELDRNSDHAARVSELLAQIKKESAPGQSPEGGGPENPQAGGEDSEDPETDQNFKSTDDRFSASENDDDDGDGNMDDCNRHDGGDDSNRHGGRGDSRGGAKPGREALKMVLA